MLRINKFVLSWMAFLGKVKFSIYVMKHIFGNSPLARGMRDSISDNMSLAKKYYKDYDFELLRVNNISGFIPKNVLALGVKLESSCGSWLLVSEPNGVALEVQTYLKTLFKVDREVFELETLVNVEWSGMEPNYDLCTPSLDFGFAQKFSVIVACSLLEHVIDPVQILKNLSNLLTPGGVLVLSTHNVLMPLHR